MISGESLTLPSLEITYVALQISRQHVASRTAAHESARFATWLHRGIVRIRLTRQDGERVIRWRSTYFVR